LEKDLYVSESFRKRVHFANTHFKILKVKQLLPLASQDKMIKEVDALRSTDCRLCKARTMKFSEAAKIQIFYMKASS
jgi:hypothetical protein